MVSIGGVIGVFVIIGVNTAATALITRVFRVRLDTSWGPVVFALLLIPVVLVIFTQILGGLGFGFDLGGAQLVVGITIVLPLALGIVFDYFWMPDPGDIELPEEYRQNS